MASRLNPYISFNNSNARPAMEFYKDVFGGELTFSTYGEFGDPSGDGADNIMHGQLETPSGFTLMGADNPPGSAGPEGSNMSVSLSGDDADELRGYYTKLAEGGQISVPMEKQMWGDEFGMLTDKFGVGWMVNIVAAKD
ncbi:VOC family protein [Actinokineospora sp. HUAS TT18]|uniref:VOC family protein n=1 Tax=Actinokineospora sp. HUAS TT18 TaxID=3447451 RepID=UPI003F52261C